MRIHETYESLHGNKWMEDLWRKPWNILNIEISVDSRETCKIISVFHGLKVIDLFEHPHAWGSLLLLLPLLPNDCVLVDRYDKHYDKHFNSFTSWNITIFFLEAVSATLDHQQTVANRNHGLENPHITKYDVFTCNSHCERWTGGWLNGCTRGNHVSK